jgi:ATP-dependent Lon protease
VVIPAENQKDLAELPRSVRRRLEIKLATTVDDVLQAALERRRPTPSRTVLARPTASS